MHAQAIGLALFQNAARLFIVYLGMCQIYFSCLFREWAVYINSDRLQPSFMHELVKNVQDILCPADCKGGDNDIAAPFEGHLDGLGKLFYAFLHAFVKTVAVRRFHDNIICRLYTLRVIDYGVTLFTYITGKYDLLFGSTIVVP